jgi:hypothetical protein
MSNQQVKNIIKVLYEQSRKESDHLAKFFLLWRCFNQCLTHEFVKRTSGKRTDRAMIDWLKKQSPSSSDLIECFERCKAKSNFTQSLRFLAKNSPYKDTRGKQEIIVKNENDFGNIIDAIYLIRCNLFHGGTDPVDEVSKKQLELALNILNIWVATLNQKING